MDDEHDILVEEDGTIRFVYSDTLAPVFEGEQLLTRRASHVEPANGSGVFGNEWVADMSPSGGPLLGPFVTRQAALDAERRWLREHRGL